ncbi:MAG: hypothetical protein ABSG84_19070 [Acidobacteriaceae bacterium]
MSEFKIDCDWIDQPAATDSLDRRTWAGLRIQVGFKTVTLFVDNRANGTSKTIYVPTFSIADWIVKNWWPLLFEPAKEIETSDWRRRHSLRTADSGSMLPHLRIFSDDRYVSLKWDADPQQVPPHLPGFFLDSGLAELELNLVESSLAEFVQSVLERVGSSKDLRLSNLRNTWDAVTGADASEAAFCRTAGRLGLDPYETEAWPSGLVELLEEQASDDNRANLIFDDLISTVSSESARSAWKVVNQTTTKHHLCELKSDALALARDSSKIPARFGYEAAEMVRQRSGINSVGPVTSVAKLSESAGFPRMRLEYNGSPARIGVRALVGGNANNSGVLVAKEPSWSSAKRFLEARGLYLMMFGCSLGPRLVTDAHVWDQKAARAFAAELLAPREQVVEIYQDRIKKDDSTEEASLYVAKHFDVSDLVIANQLKNAPFDPALRSSEDFL